MDKIARCAKMKREGYEGNHSIILIDHEVALPLNGKRLSYIEYTDTQKQAAKPTSASSV